MHGVVMVRRAKTKEGSFWHIVHKDEHGQNGCDQLNRMAISVMGGKSMSP